MKCSLLRLLLISEFFFSFGIEVLKTTTGFVFGHELSLNFADVIEQDVYILIYLGIGGGACFILGLISDLYLGKYYTTVLGLLMAIASSGFGFLSFLNKIPVDVFLLAYMTTSQIRNLIIIEQVNFLHSPKELRMCIFYMVYMRLIGRGFFLVLTQTNYATSVAMNVALGIASVVFLFYLILFLAVGGFFYIEPVYINILCIIMRCLRNAMRNKRDRERGASFYDIKHKRVIRDKTAKEPMPNKICWCYSAITKEQIAQTVHEPEKSPVPDIKEEESDPYYYISCLIPYAHKRRETLDPKRDTSLAVLADTSVSGPSNVKEVVFNAVPIEVKKEKPFIITSDKHREKPTHTFEDEDLDEWLFRASPKSSNYIIYQTMKLEAFFRYIFLGFIYVWLCLFITLYTSHQEAIALKTDEWVLASTGLRVVSFSVIFELILFPVVELIFAPAIRHYFQNSMAPVALGHFILLLAGFVMLVVQIILVRTVPYIPESTTGQIRVYNSLLIKSSIYSVVTGYKEIYPLDFIFVSDIHIMGKFPMHVTFEDDRTPLDTSIVIEASTTSSYVIRNKGIIKNKNDPTILFAGEIYASKLFLIIDKANFSATVVLEDYEDFDKEIHLNVSQNIVLGVEPSSYKITFYMNDGIENTEFITNYTFEKGTLSAIFLNNDASHPVGNVLHLEGPQVILFEHLLIHTFLKSLANAFATVSFYRDIYVESPDKIRSSLFGFIAMLNFLNYAVMNTDMFFYHGTHGVHTTFAILFYCGHVVIFILSMFTLYR